MCKREKFCSGFQNPAEKMGEQTALCQLPLKIGSLFDMMKEKRIAQELGDFFMYRKWLPDYFYKDIYTIEYEALWKKGYRGLIFDLDNTICSYSTAKPTIKIMRFIASLQEMGFQVFIVSNNSRQRVEKFNEDLHLPIMARAQKPLTGAILRAIKRMGLKKSQVAVVGDQIYTDVWGGNRAGITTVLVEPVENRESLFFRIKRALEAPVLEHYQKHGK